MRKSKIRPPRIPKAESAKVTITLLKRQLEQMAGRCADLVEERDQAMNEKSMGDMHRRHDLGSFIARAETSEANLRVKNAELEECQARWARTEALFEGYRSAAQELVRMLK